MNYHATKILTRPPGVSVQEWDGASYEQRIALVNRYTDRQIQAALAALRTSPSQAPA